MLIASCFQNEDDSFILIPVGFFIITIYFITKRNNTRLSSGIILKDVV